MVQYAIILPENHGLISASLFLMACNITKRTIKTALTDANGDNIYLTSSFLCLKSDGFTTEQMAAITAAAGQIFTYDQFTDWKNDWQTL